MDADSMADAIAWFLDQEEGWSATFDGLGEIQFTNEDGKKFLITVTDPSDED